MESIPKMHKNLNYLINHVFLPLKLPSTDDSDAKKSASLTEEVLATLKLLQDRVVEQERSEWTSCIKMVDNTLKLRDHFGGLVAEKVETTLEGMIDGGTNEPAFGDQIDD